MSAEPLFFMQVIASESAMLEFGGWRAREKKESRALASGGGAR
jgi:hypothetical protein